jgi:hypothetical protein
VVEEERLFCDPKHASMPLYAIGCERLSTAASRSEGREGGRGKERAREGTDFKDSASAFCCIVGRACVEVVEEAEAGGEAVFATDRDQGKNVKSFSLWEGSRGVGCRVRRQPGRLRDLFQHWKRVRVARPIRRGAS